jgi:predicted transcriptional regulator of viral defense system
MNFIEFRSSFIGIGCVNTNQIVAQFPEFNYNNLTRWVKQGLLVKLRQGYYSFPELRGHSDFTLYLSNRIYKPSYISLHSVLAFYGIIPEAVTQITAVSSLKTAEFQNDFGAYTYKKVQEDLFFGYELKPFGDKSILFAYPEKALLDLLYLYPFYDSSEELDDLRLDEEYIANNLDRKRLDEYTTRFGSKALTRRVALMKKTYGL